MRRRRPARPELRSPPLQGLHATTTLQALVNLKRPTLLLQQLPVPQNRDQSADVTPTGPSPPLHLLKFNYDAMTPKVSITLSVHQPLPAAATSSSEHVAPEPPRVIYSGLHPGGFNQTFQLPPTAALDLTSAIAPTPPAAPADDNDDDKSVKPTGEGEGNTATGRDSHSEETSRSSVDRNHQHSSTTPDLAVIPELPSTSAEAAAAAAREERPPRRFGIFPRRSRPSDVESGDIELANAQASAPATPGEDIQEKPEEPKVEEPEYGMRLLIRIEAAGPEGQTLRRRNAQLTHILISGMWVPDAGSTPQEGPGKRVWVIKVVRREALVSTILVASGAPILTAQDWLPLVPAQGDLRPVVELDFVRARVIPSRRGRPVRVHTKRVHRVSHEPS